MSRCGDKPSSGPATWSAPALIRTQRTKAPQPVGQSRLDRSRSTWALSCATETAARRQVESSEALALNTLMKERKGRYQLSGPNAFNYYGFDEQIPVRLYVYNNRISGDWKIGALDMTLIKVADSRLGDTGTVPAPDGETAVYSSRVRTLVDAVYDWSRFNGIPRGYEWIRRELNARRISAAELVLCTLRYGDKGTIRRMGVLLEKEGVEEKLLRKLERALTPTKGPIPWIPGKPKRGPVAGRWGVVVNDEASSA